MGEVVAFLRTCPDGKFLDFVECIFQTDDYRKCWSQRDYLVSDINDLLLIDDWAAFGRDGMRGQPWRIEDGESADGAERLPFLSPLTSWLQTRRLSMSRALDQLFKK
jgi:hypothetical protein